MTFEELVKRVAKDHGLPNHKTEAVIRQALKVASQEALNGGTAPKFPGIGRFVTKAVRSTGRKPDGTQWSKPGRTKLALSPSVHVGGESKAKNKPALDQVA